VMARHTQTSDSIAMVLEFNMVVVVVLQLAQRQVHPADVALEKMFVGSNLAARLVQ
jgi:hypothetical protein